MIMIGDVTRRTEPIDCGGLNATRIDGTGKWLVKTEECQDEMEQDDVWVLHYLNKNLGRRYRKCVAWRNTAGCNYACIEMCNEWQRGKCRTQQEDDLSKG